MEEILINYNTAILAKELKIGIDLDIFCTQSYLQKYFREKYNCHVEVTYYWNSIRELKDIKYSVEVNYYGKNFQIPITEDADIEKWGFLTYEDALEYGLFEAMKLIKIHEILP